LVNNYDVAVIGDINLDIILPVRNLPTRGSMEYARDIIKSHGGVGRNIAIALSRLGLRTVLISAVGNDDISVELLRELKENGVDVSRIRIVEGMFTGTIIVIVDEEGERTMIGHRGANAELKIEEEDLQVIEKTRHLHVSGYMLLNKHFEERIIELLKHVKQCGITTSIDIEGVAEHKPTLVENLKGCFDYVMTDENEARKSTREDNPSLMGEILLRKIKAKVVVLKMGARGCFVTTLEESFHIPSFQVNVVDTTGAGDVFNAGFMYGVVRNLGLRKAALLANAMGAYKCMWFGVRKIPSLEDLSDFFPELKELVFL